MASNKKQKLYIEYIKVWPEDLEQSLVRVLINIKECNEMEHIFIGVALKAASAMDLLFRDIVSVDGIGTPEFWWPEPVHGQWTEEQRASCTKWARFVIKIVRQVNEYKDQE